VDRLLLRADEFYKRAGRNATVESCQPKGVTTVTLCYGRR